MHLLYVNQKHRPSFMTFGGSQQEDKEGVNSFALIFFVKSKPEKISSQMLGNR